MGDVTGFIRKNGRIIPLHAATGGTRAGKTAAHAIQATRAVKIIAKTHGQVQAHKQGTESKVKINRALDMTGIGLSVASGIVAAATFSGGWKSLAAGAVASHAIDAAGIAANVASVAGKGQTKDRAIQAGKQEARNFAIGNAVYGAGLIGIKKNREELIKYGEKAAGYAKQIVALGRKVLRVAE